MALGGPELIILLLFFAIPILVLHSVAKARGQSPKHALWGVLGLLGLIIGLLVLIALPSRPTAAEKTEKPSPPSGVF